MTFNWPRIVLPYTEIIITLGKADTPQSHMQQIKLKVFRIVTLHIKLKFEWQREEN